MKYEGLWKSENNKLQLKNDVKNSPWLNFVHYFVEFSLKRKGLFTTSNFNFRFC